MLRPQIQPLGGNRPDHRGAPFEERLADEARFIKAWFDDPATTGAVSPSGRWLARMMASYVDPACSGPIVELGSGTGPITEGLVARGIAPERLILVETDATFCQLLARRYPAATIVKGDAYRLAETLAEVLYEPIAAVVSSLPLLNTPERQRLELLRDAFALMRSDGCFVQFTYGMISPIPRSKLGIGHASFEAEASPPVWLNLPPARVWVYRRASGFARVRRPTPGETLLGKLRDSTGKVKEELRLRTDHLRSEIGRNFGLMRHDAVRRINGQGKRRAEPAFVFAPPKNQRKTPRR